MLGSVIYDRLEDITAFGTCLLVVNVDWGYEVVRVVLGVGTSILSGYIVHLLKKKWEKDGKKD